MKLELTRRSFGLLALSAAVVGVPEIPLAKSGGYANPQLLMEPEKLLGLVSPTESLTTTYEDEGMVLVDVRPHDDFAAGHIPGARHLDPNAVVAGNSPVNGSLKSQRDIEILLSELGVAADRRVVLYDDKGGFHAARMFWLLEYLGHRDVALLNGGWTAWVELGGPVTASVLAHDKAQFASAPSPRRYATADYIIAHRDHADTVVVDVRPTKMYREGHIPWAINVPWAQNRAEDMRYKPAEWLTAHFESFGITPDRNVVLHCQTGLASAHSYVALRLLGFPRVRVYHRSWAEWGSDPALPKAVS